MANSIDKKTSLCIDCMSKGVAFKKTCSNSRLKSSALLDARIFVHKPICGCADDAIGVVRAKMSVCAAQNSALPRYIQSNTHTQILARNTSAILWKRLVQWPVLPSTIFWTCSVFLFLLWKLVEWYRIVAHSIASTLLYSWYVAWNVRRKPIAVMYEIRTKIFGSDCTWKRIACTFEQCVEFP